MKLSRRRALDAAVALASTSVLLYIIFENFAGPGLPTAVSIAVFALVNLTALMFTGTARRCEFHTLRVLIRLRRIPVPEPPWGPRRASSKAPWRGRPL
ncbi:hypothetical protein [Thermogymnomonas acidicola]|uniref:hypothetical protein n=1 Tax=Thermogymnomonas acidicola TaxID=399579 RepID=UPI0014940112|nr:hypothetical protein [Thermogymnomonas acidicola]